MRILAISGSLRAKSSSTSLIEAASLVAPNGVTVTVYNGLGTLPHFNPDLDGEGAVPPPEVAELRRQVGEADALIISTPEYAHGVPGSLKNALDWLVSSFEFPGISVALINPSHSSFHANESLAEILRTMSARFPPGASVRIPVPVRSMDAAALAANSAVRSALEGVIQAIVRTGPRQHG
jgi:Predicted flavoprotein